MSGAGQRPNQSAFAGNNPEFDLGRIEDSHQLILNKYCVLRPQFVLPTLEYRSQEEPLDEFDLQAAWSVITSLRNKYMAIYNCGANAGRSVEYKHLQVLPQPAYLEQPPFFLLIDQNIGGWSTETQDRTNRG
jgi:ATP adenylyltransferase